MSESRDTLQAVIAEHRKDILLEAQARAVEYGQMFQYNQLRTQLLEHMPPLDAAAYARSAAAAGKLDAAPAELVGHKACAHAERSEVVTHLLRHL